jgi:hypothetical protein
MRQAKFLVARFEGGVNRRHGVTRMGSIQTLAIVIVRVVPIVVLVQVMVGVEGLVRVVGVPDPTWNSDRGNIHSRSGLIRIPLREVVVEQGLGSLSDVLPVGFRTEIPGSDTPTCVGISRNVRSCVGTTRRALGTCVLCHHPQSGYGDAACQSHCYPS